MTNHLLTFWDIQVEWMDTQSKFNSKSSWKMVGLEDDPFLLGPGLFFRAMLNFGRGNDLTKPLVSEGIHASAIRYITTDTSS